MKKLLLGTSALFGAVALFSGAASAEAPRVTVGGAIDVQAGISSEDSHTTLPQRLTAAVTASATTPP